ncbi:hypothetical protein ACFV42_23095 [Streptomyces solisilvae]|uniref:hypothetical protein n=1 Tax=Streptomyces malaysiensis TaxID=92644 RepID=UPI0036B89A18
MTASMCPDCRAEVEGVGRRYHCRYCDCLFSENPEDRGVRPVCSRSWNYFR